MEQRWKIKTPKKSIVWDVGQNDSHYEDYEMGGYYCAHILKYGVNEDGTLSLFHHPVFPTVRIRPNNTHASFQRDTADSLVSEMYINGEKLTEYPRQITIDGTLCIRSDAGNGISTVRHFYPSTFNRIAYERFTVENNSDNDVEFRHISENERILYRETGCMGITQLVCDSSFIGKTVIPAHGRFVFYVMITGRVANEPFPREDPEKALCDRYENIDRLTSFMQIETGDDIIDTFFTFALIRSGESIFRTRSGLLHSPGGYSYYAAVWCNDEVEYAGPHFAFTGDHDLLEASMNAYKLYMPFMDDSYQPIPSSIVAEGFDFWNGAGDRGDAAMYLYGASHFALISGDREKARQLLGAIKWCAEYCERKKNRSGVIKSDKDELEGRFSAGSANLCTSTLCYSGLRTSAILLREFGENELADTYEKRADKLAKDIEKYFGASVGGFETYRYHKGNELLRSWICMPLCVGLTGRTEGTVKALTCDEMLTENGILTQQGTKTFWDRATLYALRGIFASGYTEKATDLLLTYCKNRLLGQRVPYPVEAYPEGNKRHLSGESALFCKVFTEGLMAIEPLGFNTFSIKPCLPEEIDHIYLRKIHAFGTVFDVEMEKDGFRVRNYNGTILGSGKYGQKIVIRTI